MAEYMQEMGEQPVHLSAEEQNSLSVAHTSAVGNRCGAWCIITSVERKEIYDGIVALMDEPVVLQKQAPTIQEVLKMIEFLLVQNVDEIIDEPIVTQRGVSHHSNCTENGGSAESSP